MKKTLSCILALIITLLPLLCACAETGDSSVTTTQGSVATETTTSIDTTVAPTPFERLEKENLNGYVFHILYPQADSCYLDFYAENINGDIKNDLIYERNSAVTEALNFQLDIKWETISDVLADVKTQFMAGDRTYDMFGGHRDALALSYGGYLYDLASMEELDFSQEWWDQGWVNALTINGSLYTAVGDMSVASLLFVSGLCFNKQMLANYGLESPYALVREGKWTLEELEKLTADVGDDLDQNGKMDLNSDLFAIIGWGYESSYSMFYSSGFTFMNRDGEGDYNLNFDMERVSNINKKIVELWKRDNSLCFFSSGDADHNALYSTFATGRALFADICLSKIGTFFTSMTDDYGVIPSPKFDADQEKYLSYCGYTIPMAMVCQDCPDPHRTAIIMEAFTTASYDMVTPKMLEIVTKLKNVRDEDSGEMIEIIYRNKLFDTAHFFNLPGYGNFAYNTVKGETTNVASVLKASEKIAEKQWAIIQEAYDKLSNSGK